ncbi:MAG: phospho-N-acetylmuramoyl-pentapeptide-transferase, partial [Victivallis vadensis]
MLYLLSQFSDHFGPLRLFDYVTFRAGGAALTAFLLVILLGGWTARKLKALNAQAATRLEGLVPAEFIDREKDRTPCMGGVLLIGATLVSSVLWNQIDDPISIVLILSTLGFS